ncbi:hypothetical protein [Microbacterium sp. HJ5]
MPRVARPANADAAEDPIKAFGSMLKAGIIGHLRAHPNGGRKEISDALALPEQTVITGIDELLKFGLIVADPPREVATRGQRVRYRVNDEAVTEMYLRLGIAIGEI